MYYTWKKWKSHTKIISVPEWNEAFELYDGPYYISDIQDYFE